MTSSKIRLLHLTKNLDMGGVEKSTILYSNYLTAKLNFVGIFASNGFYDDTNIISQKVKRFIPPYKINSKIYFIRNILFLFKVIKNKKITHIHYHHRIFIPFIYLIKLKYPNIKILYTHHSCFYDLINNFIYADKIIAINEATKKYLPKHLRKNCIIIPHGVRIKPTFNNISNTLNNIGYVGRFVEHKGLFNLLNSFKELTDKKPQAKLILVGNGLLKNEIIKVINRLDIKEHIIFRKSLVSEDEIYSDIDILVLPSEKLEGFGLVLIEAMSRGIPVVVSKMESFKDLVIDEFNGLVFKDNLKDKLLNLLNNKNLYNKLSLNAFETVSRKYHIERSIKEYLEKIYISD